MKKKIIHGIIIGAAASAVALLLSCTGSINWLENITWNWRVKLLHRLETPADNIRLVLLDQTSLDWADREMKLPWPWPRQLYQPFLLACKEGGAKAVIFDFVFTEPSFIGGDDEMFEKTLKETDNFVSTLILSNEQGSQTNWPGELNLKSFQIKNSADLMTTGPARNLIKSNASFPLDYIATNAVALGGIMGEQDSDAIIRHMTPFNLFDNHFIPTLGLAAYLAGNPDSEISVTRNYMHVGDINIPLDRRGRAILRYRGPSMTHKAINAGTVLQSGIRLLEGKQPSMDLSFFKDAYVFFGANAAAIKDLRPTPLQKDYPGVELHATMLDNLLQNDFIAESHPAAGMVLALILAVTAGIIIRTASKGIYAGIIAVILIFIPAGLGIIEYTRGYWLPIAMPGVAVFMATAAAVIINYAIEGRQKRFIKSAFSQYLSHAVIERLVANPDHLSLGGEARTLTIFFSDVAGFTSISEALTPESLTALLNDYLTAMTDIIMEEGGTIDKYEGDAIIAFWNAPLDIPDHAECAVRAALRCQQKITELNSDFRKRIGRDLSARIGINTGKVVVGNMGSTQRFDYTFLGDAGNLASRLEGINKEFGTNLMVSEYTMKETSGKFKARELSKVRVVGRNEPVTVFEPVTDDVFAARTEDFKTFNDALNDYYEGRFKDALDKFSSMADHDPPSNSYVNKCRYLIDNPPESWEGVWIMTKK